MDFETAMAMKAEVIGRSEHIDGALREAADVLQVNGEVNLAVDGPDYGQAQIWVDTNRTGHDDS